MRWLSLIKESISFAIDAIVSNRTRTYLSILGITIGITTIVGVFAAVDTLKANLESSVEKLGSRTLYIQKWPWGGGGDYPWWKFVNRPEPTFSDYNLLKQKMQTASALAFSIGIENRTAKFMNNDVSGIVVSASTHEMHEIRDLTFTQGRYFSESESERGSPVVIIGSTIAEGLFPQTDPIGKSITLLGRRFTVIGVFEREGEGMLIDVSLDRTAMIPINIARNLVNIRRQNPSILIQAREGVDLREVEAEAKVFLRAHRRIGPQEEDDFSVNKTTIISAQLNSLFQILHIAGIFIGGFSMLVGGFGIANIMFVSVKERTPIIGIQKSLGAKDFFILSQFLVEAIVLCLIGGLLGLGLIVALALIAKIAFGMTVVISSTMVILTILLSTTIGLISGITPAIQASRLNPVDAMRS